MAQDIEERYDQFQSDLAGWLDKIDVELALKIMYLERKFPDVEPRADLDIKLMKGVDPEKKRFELNSKYGLLTGLRGKRGLYTSGRMNMKDIQELSHDSDVEKITGTAVASPY